MGNGCLSVDDNNTKDSSKEDPVEFIKEAMETKGSKSIAKRWPLSFEETAKLCGNFLIDGDMIPAQNAESDAEGMVNKWLESDKEPIIAVLDMETASYYQSFQVKAAEMISNEGERPTVKLVIKDCQSPDIKPLFAFGFLGGMGPLADAEVLLRTIKYIEKCEVMPEDIKRRIELKVCSETQPFSTADGMIHDIKTRNIYNKSISDFLCDPYTQTFEITSNSAHSNMNLYDAIQIAVNANPFGKGRRMFVDVIATTSNLINQIKTEYLEEKNENAKVVLLGTDDSWKNEIYQTALNNIDCLYVDIDYDHKLVIDGKVVDEDKMYNLIDNAIQEIKKGNNEDGKTNLLQLIYDIGEIEKKNSNVPINIVAFTCSEISISIQAKEVKELSDVYSNSFIVDTTELMAINGYNEILKEYQKWETTKVSMKMIQ